MSERRFPILSTSRISGGSIPWTMIAEHEAQAQKNHYQTLERLAERGGLSWGEALAVLTDRRELILADMPEKRDAVCELVREWEAKQ